MDKFVFLLELIGTVAFAASGSLTAMRRHMDLLGVIVLGVITSVGGGILRDVILGITPPRLPRPDMHARGRRRVAFAVHPVDPPQPHAQPPSV